MISDCHPQKVEAALSLERRRYADLLTEQKKNALGQKTIMPKAKKLDIPMTGTQPRFDLNELRHNQRRCAALLFGARERGAHKLPILVCLGDDLYTIMAQSTLLNGMV